MAKQKTIKTPIGRCSFVHISTPKENSNGVLKYSLTLMFPKKQTDMKPLKQFILKCIKGSDKWSGYDKGKVTINDKTKRLTLPIKDGDVKYEENNDYENYRGMWYIEFASNYAPGICNRQREDIIDAKEIYSGMWGRVECHCYSWVNEKGKQGVSFGLNNFQKTKNDTAFTAFRSASEAFDDDDDLGEADEEFDDDMSYEDDDPSSSEDADDELDF